MDSFSDLYKKHFKAFEASGACSLCGTQRCDGTKAWVKGCKTFLRWVESEELLSSLNTTLNRPTKQDDKRITEKMKDKRKRLTNKKQRISKDEYYLGIAEAVLKRSTCLRRNYGAVIVKDDVIVATGYNGAPRGMVNCCDVGICERERQNVPKGERYELCVAIHAEDNAISAAGRQNCLGATLYLCGMEMDGTYAKPDPCLMCARKILNSGIVRICGRSVDGSIIDIPVRA